MSLDLVDIVLAGVAVVLLIVVVALLARRGRKSLYECRDGLFTPAERSFLGALDRAVGEGHRVFGKVRVADLVTPARGLRRKTWWKAFNRISARQAGYVVCRREDLTPLAVVELDDLSRAKSLRRRRDADLETVFAAAGLPLLRFPAQKSYSISHIRSHLESALAVPAAEGTYRGRSAPPSSRPEPWIEDPARRPPRAGLGVNGPPRPSVKEKPRAEPPAESRPPSPPECPRCGKSMERRTARKGAHAGKSFWTCTGYPECRGVLPARADGAGKAADTGAKPDRRNVG